MTVLSNVGPLVIYKGNPLGTVGSTGGLNQNPDEGPCLEHIGGGLLDPRVPFTYFPGMGNGVGLGLAGGSPGIYGVAGNPTFSGFMGGDYVTVDQVPSQLQANNIAASQSPGAGAINLVSTSGAGVTTGVSIVRADTGAVVTGLLAIDNPMAPWGFGITGVTSVWDPTRAVARAVQYTSGGVDTGITFTMSGYDLYGYPMSETVTGTSSTANGKKAFKYVASVTHTASVASTLTIGTQDIYGLPIRTDRFADITAVAWNNTWLTSLTTYTAAVTTNPATTTTGDVRGTIGVPSASDSTKRLTIYQSPNLVNLSGAQTLSVTSMTSASPGVITITANGFAVGQPLQFFPIGGALSPPVVPGTTYYVSVVLTANTFNISATPGGASINTTGASSGTVNAVAFGITNTVTGLFGVAQNTATTNGA